MSTNRNNNQLSNLIDDLDSNAELHYKPLSKKEALAAYARELRGIPEPPRKKPRPEPKTNSEKAVKEVAVEPEVIEDDDVFDLDQTLSDLNVNDTINLSETNTIKSLAQEQEDSFIDEDEYDDFDDDDFDDEFEDDDFQDDLTVIQSRKSLVDDFEDDDDLLDDDDEEYKTNNKSFFSTFLTILLTIVVVALILVIIFFAVYFFNPELIESLTTSIFGTIQIGIPYFN